MDTTPLERAQRLKKLFPCSPTTARGNSHTQSPSPRHLHPPVLRLWGPHYSVPNLRLIADSPPLKGAGVGLLLEVGPEGEDTLLLQHHLRSSLTWFLRTQCLEPAVQGTQLFCGDGRKKGIHQHDLEWASKSGPPPSLREGSPVIFPSSRSHLSAMAALSSYASKWILNILLPILESLHQLPGLGLGMK